ncbi:hypothetical protein SUGI_0063560 [Cryptomeria japonica]|nr:hypothetical protein SUGI_0063560 [Cryptomeria japonica]
MQGVVQSGWFFGLALAVPLEVEVCVFFRMGFGFFWLNLLTPICHCGVGFVVSLRLGSVARVFMLHILHLWVTLVSPIEAVLSSIEGEMDVA